MGRRERGQRPWRPDTLVDVYSVGKPLVALLALQLVEAGRMELDDPISSVWPEFGAAGKERATLRQALCHRAGVPAIRESLTDDDLWDWGRMSGALAATEPWWEPGTRHAYHTNTYGHLIGEVVRRTERRVLRGPAARVVGPAGRRRLVRGPSGRNTHRCAEVIWAGAAPAVDDRSRRRSPVTS